MSEEPRLLVALSSAFENKSLFNEKMTTLTSALEGFSVIAVNDLHCLAQNLFGGTLTNSVGRSMHLREKRQLLKSVQMAAFFWDGTDIDDFIYLASLYRLPARIIAVETTRTVNKERGDEFDIYIGRGTPWGNPFAIGDNGADRAAVLQMFEDYFQKKYVDDAQGSRDILSLKGKVLGCHCKPLPCHGDIIARYLNSI